MQVSFGPIESPLGLEEIVFAIDLARIDPDYAADYPIGNLLVLVGKWYDFG